MKIGQIIRNNYLKSLSFISILFGVGFVLGQGFVFTPQTSIVFLKIYSIPLILVSLAILAAPRMKRFFVYFTIWCFLSYISSMFMLYSMFFYLSIVNIENISYPRMIIYLVLAILVLVVSKLEAKVRFNRAKNLNIETEKVNLTDGTIDFEKPIYLDDPKLSQRRKLIENRIQRFSFFAFLLGTWIVRIFDLPLERLTPFVLLTMVYLVAYLSGTDLNFLTQIRRWEKEIGKPILIKKP